MSSWSYSIVTDGIGRERELCLICIYMFVWTMYDWIKLHLTGHALLHWLVRYTSPVHTYTLSFSLSLSLSLSLTHTHTHTHTLSYTSPPVSSTNQSSLHTYISGQSSTCQPPWCISQKLLIAARPIVVEVDQNNVYINMKSIKQNIKALL